MTDPRICAVAKIIVDYSTAVKPGDLVYVETEPAATPMVQELFRLLTKRGAHPVAMVDLPELKRIFLENASDEQLQFMPPVHRLLLETFDVRLDIGAPSNTRELSSVDPARQALRSKSLAPLMKTFMDRSASGSLRWNVFRFPTNAYAQEADMSLTEFEDFVYNACLANDPDPIESWKRVRARQQILVDWLNGKREVHLIGPDTDLHVGVAGRTWINCWGDMNMPDGEVFTGPEETKVNGTVRFTFPAIHEGREVEDVRLWFEDGVVVKCSAVKNQAYLEQMLHADEGASRLGEFACGTNFGIQRFVKNMLFDEKIGGTVHMALGAGYPETGSVNESGIHWDMICDLRQGGEVYVDGELFAKDGHFILWDES